MTKPSRGPIGATQIDNPGSTSEDPAPADDHIADRPPMGRDP